MRLTWKRQESERGLARVCQSPRGADLRLDGQRIAAVRPSSRLGDTWYWHTFARLPHRNTAGAPTSFEQAKRDAMAYAREHLSPAKAAT